MQHVIESGGRTIEIKDVNAQRLEYHFKPPRLLASWLESLIADHRDLPIMYLFYNITLITLPSAVLVFALGSNYFGCIYWFLNLLLFQERFLIGLHYSSHRGLFKDSNVTYLVTAILSPFFGVPSGMYHMHHVIMHHSENNLDGWDLSSTERYQRDNVLHFVHYWIRFLALIWFELPYYAWKRRRYGQALQVLTFTAAFWCTVTYLYFLSPCGAFWVFIFPTVFNSLLLMLGNWSQHIFVNPTMPRSNYALTYNVINDQCNQRSFNDGYHIEHHINSRRHWTELPASFIQNVGNYAIEDALVFENMDPIKIGVLVFLGKYDTLNKHLIQFRQPPRTPTEVEAMLRSRLVPIPSKA